MSSDVSGCSLRPLDVDDLPLFEQIYSFREGAGDYQWFGFSPPGRGVAELGAIGREGGRLTVVSQERTVGSVFWFRHEWSPPDTSWCWEIAVHVFPEARGKGIGVECQRQLCVYLFSHTTAWRLQAVTDAENTAEQRALARIGFTKEGVLRGAQWREGRWRDQVMYSLLRSDRIA